MKIFIEKMLYLSETMNFELPGGSGAHVSLTVHQLCAIETIRVQKIQLCLLHLENPVIRTI